MRKFSYRKFSSESNDKYLRIEGYGFVYFKLNDNLSSDEKILLGQQQLVLNFKNEHKALNINDYDAIMRFIQMNKDAKIFFLRYKKVMEALSIMPKAFLDAGFDLDSWNELVVKRDVKTKIVVKFSKDTEAESKQHLSNMAKLNSKLKLDLSVFTGPERLLGLQASDLDDADQIQLSNETDSLKRKSLQKELLYKKQLSLLQTYMTDGKFPSSF
jgi:hypothetical protein